VRIGVSPWGSSRDGIIRVAVAAADAGIDTFWLGDGLLIVPDFPQWSGGMEPFAQLGWLAGRHPNVSVGLGAAILPLRDVLYVAKQAATLDQLTEGHFTLAVTPGFWDREFSFRGLSFQDRGRRFDDALAALRAIFKGEPYDGEFISVPADGRLSPRPFTPGGPALWLAGGRPTIERALTAGLPFQARTTSPARFASLAKEWFERGGAELAMRITMIAADDVSAGDTADGGVTHNDALIGPPVYLAEQLDAYRQLGLAEVSLMPGRSDEQSLRTIEALATEILPSLAVR
jgi:alkanesulfonate monooxygenase SsuD/methylene tetrahydromethanopterin reductase-like flavin-dependent oxidoreductase (luciferase family)